MRFVGLIAVLLAYAHLLLRFVSLEAVNSNVLLVLLLLIMSWAGYILFSFGDIGRKLSRRKTSINVSKKY